MLQCESGGSEGDRGEDDDGARGGEGFGGEMAASPVAAPVAVTAAATLPMMPTRLNVPRSRGKG